MSQAINLIPLGIIHTDVYDYCRQPLMKLIEAEWRADRLILWGYYKGENWNKSKPIPYPDNTELELDWVTGPGREDGSNLRFPGLAYCCDVSASHRNNPNVYFWTELLIASADLDRLCLAIPEAVRLASREWRDMMGYPAIGDAPNETTVVANTPKTRLDADESARALSRSHSTPLIEAVHDLRGILAPDLRSAISQIIDMLATGQLPPADALIEGTPGKIDPRWWWAGAIKYPSSAATFSLIVDGEERLTHATEIRLDLSAWERQKTRIERAAQQDGDREGEPPRSVDLTNAGKTNGDTIRRRGAYRGALDAWMAKQELAILLKRGPAGIAQEFKAHCERELHELISLLPKRLRSMESEIQRIIERRRKSVRVRSANKGQ
jgi:hypothetical protein